MSYGISDISVRHVLAIIAGRDVPEWQGPAAAVAADPRADPLTGCLPVTAQSPDQEVRAPRRGGFNAGS